MDVSTEHRDKLLLNYRINISTLLHIFFVIRLARLAMPKRKNKDDSDSSYNHSDDQESDCEDHVSKYVSSSSDSENQIQ